MKLLQILNLQCPKSICCIYSKKMKFILKSNSTIVSQTHSPFTSSSFQAHRYLCHRPPSYFTQNISLSNPHIQCRKGQRIVPLYFAPRRLYSKDKFSNDNDAIDDKKTNQNIENDSIEYDGKKFQVEKDPWIKSLLADIQKDFNDHGEAEDSSNKEMNNNEKTARTSEIETCNVFNKETFIDLNYEYDYQNAEDIEEYGYFNEKDAIDETRPEKHIPISLNRGKAGVFELDELLTLMEHLGANNIVNVPIPREANYCDNMVIVTAKSQRHLQALNSEMLWIHKRKKSRKDPVLHIEGLEKSDWCAMDLGNVILHIFLNEERRQYYDIESLWLLGPDNDPKCREDQPSLALSAEELYWMEIGGRDNAMEPRKEGN